LLIDCLTGFILLALSLEFLFLKSFLFGLDVADNADRTVEEAHDERTEEDESSEVKQDGGK